MSSVSTSEAVKIGSLSLGEVPRIVVGFTDGIDTNTINNAMSNGLDIAELRIDGYTSSETIYVLNEVSKFREIPTIATIRSKNDGGQWKGSESDKLSLFRSIISHVDAIDIELSSIDILSDVIKTAHEHSKLAIVSYHNFDETPAYDDLVKVIKDSKKHGADIVKIACTANSRRDVQVISSLTIDFASEGLITIAMGAKGLVSRLFFPALGSLMTFAYIGNRSAPGQLHFDETLEMMRLFYSDVNQDKIINLKLMENI